MTGGTGPLVVQQWVTVETEMSFIYCLLAFFVNVHARLDGPGFLGAKFPSGPPLPFSFLRPSTPQDPSY